jgi:hypothetical protein
MGGAAYAAYAALTHAVSDSVSTIGAVAVGGVVYLIMIFVTRAVTDAELALFPKGEALVKLYRMVLTKMRVNARI